MEKRVVVERVKKELVVLNRVMVTVVGEIGGGEEGGGGEGGTSTMNRAARLCRARCGCSECMRLFRVQRVARAGRGAHGVLLQPVPRAARAGIAVSRCAPMEAASECSMGTSTMNHAARLPRAALCRSQPRARSCAAAIPMRNLERVRRGHPYRMPPSQATLGSVSSPHPRALAYLLLARCVEGARCPGSSTMPLATTRSLARSRNSYAQLRTGEAWAPTVCRHRRPLWAWSARLTRG